VNSKAAEQNPPEAEAPQKAADSSPKYVTVYTFVIYDHDRRTTAIYPRMATPATIAKMRGKVNEDTAWVVDASELDVEGFYNGPANTSA
jgi:hypothetical protein